MKVRTRFAPSPTGSLHIGSLRTALFAYALAKKNKGDFILRIEDTDRTRFVKGSAEEIKAELKIFGLEHDEYYVQSDRLEIYKKHAEELVEKGHAYYAFETKEELEKARKLSEKKKEPFKFKSEYRDLDIKQAKEKIKDGEEYVIRQRIPKDKEIRFHDELQGDMKFDTNELDDSVLLKSDGYPTYHLAVVVDDHEMKISHVIRGVEWIPSTPKHVLLYEAFGWEMPKIVHPPVILNADGKGKLSKRGGAVSVKSFLAEGFLPEAILNFLMLIGWASPEKRKHGEKEREIYSLDEFIELFEIKDLNKSSGVFNREKLLWFNSEYIKDLDDKALADMYVTFAEKYLKAKDLDRNALENIMPLVKERAKTLAEIHEDIQFFFSSSEKVNFSSIKGVKKYNNELRNEGIKKLLELVESLNDDSNKWQHDLWEKGIRDIASELKWKDGDMFMLLRLLVVGSPFSPPLFESMQILGKKECVARISKYK